jgi:hypothetical protein
MCDKITSTMSSNQTEALVYFKCFKEKNSELCFIFGSQSDGFDTTTKVVLSVFFAFLLTFFIGNRGNEVFNEGFVKYKECVSHKLYTWL